MALAKRLALTCRTTEDDEAAKKKEEEVDAELEELLDDGFLEAYMQKRMKEMMEKTKSVKRFGEVVHLDGESFLGAIDGEDKECTVILLVYEPGAEGCDAMYGCLQCLAKDHVNVKFCSILASSAGLSKHFKVSGVPALLVYRGGQLMGNFVRMTDHFGGDFFANEVESFLIEHGMLRNKEEVPSIIRGPAVNNCDSDDSVE